jgi:hypothetical protein
MNGAAPARWALGISGSSVQRREHRYDAAPSRGADHISQTRDHRTDRGGTSGGEIVHALEK